MNGTTNKDRTLYYEVMPANQLDLALFLEADRMRSLEITKENLDNQRNAVQEERRLGVDNQPYGKTFEAHRRARVRQLRLRAQRHRLDGRPQRRDRRRRRCVLQDLLRTEQRRHRDRRRRRHEGDAREGAEVFRDDPFAAGAAAGRHDRAAADRRAAARRSRTRWRGCRASTWPTRSRRAGRPTPTRCGARDRPVGRPQRALYEAIVRQKQLSSGVSASRGERAARACSASAAPRCPARRRRNSKPPSRRRSSKVQTGPIADWEMQKARNSARASFIGGLGSALNRAIELGENALAFNDPGRINTRADTHRQGHGRRRPARRQAVPRQDRTAPSWSRRQRPRLRRGCSDETSATDPRRHCDCSPAIAIATPGRAPGGQGQPPLQRDGQMVLKGKAPISNEILKVKLPKPQTATCRTGCRSWCSRTAACRRSASS